MEKQEDLERAIKMALESGFTKKALIEEFVEGKEYSLEGISFQGMHHILAMTEKRTTGAPHFIETGHLEPAHVEDMIYKKAESVVLHALDSLGIKNSASHSEIKIEENGEIKIIEIGSRMGGDCIGSDLVWYSTGIDYLKTVIQVSVGEQPDLIPKGTRQSAEVRYILTADDLAEFKRMKEEEPHRILRIADEKHLYCIGHTTDSSNRAGCYICAAGKHLEDLSI